MLLQNTLYYYYAPLLRRIIINIINTAFDVYGSTFTYRYHRDWGCVYFYQLLYKRKIDNLLDFRTGVVSPVFRSSMKIFPEQATV